MQVYQETFSWFDVPEDVKKLLVLAAENWENTAESEKYITQALAKTGDNTDVLVAAYRYFYYKNNLPLALQAAVTVVEKIKASENFPDDWEQLKKILVSRKEEPAIRLYLNAYAASGMVLAKLGEIEKAKEITARVKEIDDRNEFGAAIILDILTRPADEDDD
jgi:tetratricopeptide (TPR) repeat protein